MNIINNQKTTPQLSGHSVELKRAELKDYFRNTWTTYESLFSLINDDEAYYLRPEPLRHPLIFYFGHTATFFINKLILGKYLTQRVNKKIEAICAVGVDEMSWDDLNSEHYDWPTVAEVREYRHQVFTLINQQIDTMQLSLPIQQDSLAWLILMGCEHERIHLETSSVIMRMLPMSFLSEYSSDNKQWQACFDFSSAPSNKLLRAPEQAIILGKQTADETFGWDNEYGELALKVAEFNASKYLVSNQEYLTFIEAGGYKNFIYWTNEGQKWLTFSKAEMPRFWRKKSGEYYQRNLLNEIPLPMNWPVEVNYLEAKAFCQWKSEQTKLTIALPTEAQWACLREKLAGDTCDWQQAPANINLAHYASSCPIDRFSAGEFYDVAGNVWQWSESAIDGYDGFKVHPLYDDFSTPTFDGKHNLIKGGSWLSTGNEAIKSARYAFRRHFTQHAGFRYVENLDGIIPTIPVNHFETDNEICQQLDSHYGKTQLNQANYQQQISALVLDNMNQYQVDVDKCLNIGCGVGRTAFELSPFFQHIDAIDFSARFIQYGVKLQQQESVRYTSIISGDIVDFHEISLTELPIKGQGKNILFSQGDGCNLKANFDHYDAVVIEHALEKSYQPKVLLTTVSQRLKIGGLLFVISDFQYSTKYTEKNNWLGGVKVNGENVSGFDELSLRLSDNFNLLDEVQLTRVVKQNQCTYTVTETQLSVWQKNS